MTKKSFKAPTMNFISDETIDKVDKPEDNTTEENTIIKPKGLPKPPAGYKINRVFVETKSKRVHISMQPSLYNNAKKTATTLGISINDFIHRALHEATYNEDVLNKIKADLEAEEQLRKELQEIT